MSSARDASAVLADLVACLAAIGRSMHDAFDPRKFLEEFSAKLQRLIPHDRLAIAYLDDDRRTFTIFAEHAAKGPVLHEAHYTTGFSPAGRYPIGQGALAAMFGGGVLRLEELRDDYGFAVEGSVEHVVREAGFRSALLLPLYSGGLVIGGLVASSLTPGTHPVPRRGRRDDAVGAGQAVARLAGARVPARGRHRDVADGRAGHRGHQPRPGAGGGDRTPARGSLYRLNVFTVHLPPLRERGDDVLLLADHFVRALGFRMGKGEAGLSRDAREALLAHRWPGNIRELQNAVERALIVSDGGLIASAELGIVARAPADADRSASSARSTSTVPPATSLAESERRMVADALAKARGNKSRAAKALGLTRAQLYTRMKRFGLD